jgi:hypothetical protein
MCRLAVFLVAVALLARPAAAGPPFITDDPEPVDPGHWEIDFFSAGTTEHGDASGLGPSVEVNYGALPDVQLHVSLTTAYQSAAGANLGFGDSEFGVKYRLADPGPGDWWPQIGVFPLIEAPTGSAPRGLGAGYTQVFLPVWLQKNVGSWTTYAGAGYWITPGPGNRNFWFTGWMLGKQVTPVIALGVEVFHTTSPMVGRGGVTGFGAGGQYDLSDHYHLLFSAGRGNQLYAPNPALAADPFDYYIGLQWTF